MIKNLFGLIIIVTIILAYYAEFSNVASPIAFNITQDDIDKEYSKKIVKKESEEAFFTLKGEDKNKNGIRDDVEREFIFQYKDKDGKIYKEITNKIEHLLKKMQTLTKYEDVAYLNMHTYDEHKKLKNKAEKQRKYEFLDNHLAIKEFNKCLYKIINDHKDVGSGAKYLQVIRKQLNTKQRRDFFGEDMLFQNYDRFQQFVAKPPKSEEGQSSEMASIYDDLHGTYGKYPKNKQKIKASNIKKCTIEEFK